MDERRGGARLCYTVYGYRAWQPVPERDPTFMAADGGVEAIAYYEKYEDALDLAYSQADAKPVKTQSPKCWGT